MRSVVVAPCSSAGVYIWSVSTSVCAAFPVRAYRKATKRNKYFFIIIDILKG